MQCESTVPRRQRVWLRNDTQESESKVINRIETKEQGPQKETRNKEANETEENFRAWNVSVL